MKRFLKGLSLAGLAALVLTLSACDLTDLNENPNESADVTTPNLLVNAQSYLAETYWKDYAGGFWVRYAQYWTTNQYTDADRYAFPTARPGSNNNNWDRFYLALNDLEEIKRISRESPEEVAAYGPAANQVAIAKILQAFTFQMMTDMWGPVPFTDALKGREEGNFTPSYSSQEEIYSGLLEMLTEASDSIDASASTLASGDLVYSGDMAKWKKLANSLKLRVAIRAADVNGFTWGDGENTVEDAIDQALGAGVFESNDDNAIIPFNGSPPYQNPYYENYEVDGRNDWAAPSSLVEAMNDNDDPRLAAYFTDADPNTPGNQFNGLEYGLPSNIAVNVFNDGNYSIPSERVRGNPEAPAFIMFYDEVLFTMAEAAARGYTLDNLSGTAESHYNAAVEASLDRWGVTDSDFIKRVAYDPNDWEQSIGEQKWVALYMQGIQGWAEWRRLDLQSLLDVPRDNPGDDAFGCDFPLRMVYPNYEGAVNQENLAAGVSMLAEAGSHVGTDGDDSQGTALWWDVNTPQCN